MLVSAEVFANSCTGKLFLLEANTTDLQKTIHVQKTTPNMHNSNMCSHGVCPHSPGRDSSSAASTSASSAPPRKSKAWEAAGCRQWGTAWGRAVRNGILESAS